MSAFSRKLLPPRHAPMANEKINGFIGKLTSGSLLRLRSTGICGSRRKERELEDIVQLSAQHKFIKANNLNHK